MALQLPLFPLQFFDNAGLPAAGAKLHTYSSGTTNNKVTYSDSAGSVNNANPITLDSAGRASIYLDTGAYTFTLNKSDDATLIKSWDNITGVPSSVTGSYLPLAGGTMTGLITLSGNATAALNPTPLQQVQSLIAAAAPTATSVAVTDTADYYTGTNVETILAEIGAKFTGRLLRITAFTTSGTWTKGTDVKSIIVEGVGGGGGGGASPGSSDASGGGAGGGYFKKLLTSLSASYAVTIGAGGGSATAGGNTQFGTALVANGGGAAALRGGGAGGTASGGDINLVGGGGGFGASNSESAWGGTGGSSQMGGGAVSTAAHAATGANAANNTGGGGAGGVTSGGVGGSGLVVVYEYS